MTGTRNYFALAHGFGFEGKNFSYDNSILEHAKPLFGSEDVNNAWPN